MSTVGQLLDTTLHHLRGTRRSERSTLATTITDSETEVTISTDSNALRPSAWVQIGAELMYVQAAESRTATVERGAEGSTAAAHTAGASMEFNPRFFRHRLMDHLVTEILTWPRDQVWRVTTTTCSFTTAEPHADLVGALDHDVIRLLSARREPTASGQVVMKNRQVELLRRQPTSRFTSGYGVQLIDRFNYGTATDLRVTYAHSYSIPSAVTVSESTDIQSDLDIPQRLEQALVYGVCWRAMAATEVNRTDATAQGQQSISGDVPPTHRASVAEDLRRLRDLELGDEYERLISEYGVVKA